MAGNWEKSVTNLKVGNTFSKQKVSQSVSVNYNPKLEKVAVLFFKWICGKIPAGKTRRSWKQIRQHPDSTSYQLSIGILTYQWQCPYRPNIFYCRLQSILWNKFVFYLPNDPIRSPLTSCLKFRHICWAPPGNIRSIIILLRNTCII